MVELLRQRGALAGFWGLKRLQMASCLAPLELDDANSWQQRSLMRSRVLQALQLSTCWLSGTGYVCNQQVAILCWSICSSAGYAFRKASWLVASFTTGRDGLGRSVPLAWSDLVVNASIIVKGSWALSCVWEASTQCLHVPSTRGNPAPHL